MDLQEQIDKETEIQDEELDMKEFVKDIRDNLKNGKDVIADATHLNWSSRRKLLKALGDVSAYDIVPVVVSVDLALISWELSNFHSSEPSSFTSFHHLNPTNILPDTFLTNQKSREFKITTNIKIKASGTPKIPKNKNANIANPLKNIVKNTIPGCCA